MKSEIVFGKDVELQVGTLVKRYGGSKVLIIMDGGNFIKASGLFDRVTGSLAEQGIAWCELGGVQPNPRRTLVYQGLEIVKKENIDFLIPIGGGSTMDTAKAISMASTYEGDFWDLFLRKAQPKPGIPIGAISTIAATGSETSSSSMICDDLGTQEKLGCGTPFNRSTFAIMNPELTYSVPAYHTAAGTTDILAHSFDSYFVPDSSFLGDSFLESAMRTAVKYGPLALKNPKSYEARAELMLAASFSHNDTCRIGRGKAPLSAHNFERNLGAYLDATHGAGLAVIMPAYLQYLLDNRKETAPRIARFAVKVFDVSADPCNPEEVAQKGIDCFRTWLRDMGMPSTLKDLSRTGKLLSDADLEKILDRLWYERNGEVQAYGHLSREDVRNIFLSVRGY